MDSRENQVERNMDARQNTSERETAELWPPLLYEEWKDTYDTLHMWTQIVGKVRMELTPLVNHWWNVPFYLTARGLTTSPIPYRSRTFAVDFDFIDHNLFIQTSEGTSKAMPLIPRSVADFYREFMEALRSLNINVIINTLPSEVTNPIRCDEDVVHASYDPEYANRFWRILVQSDNVFKAFRSQFIGKSSPVHFFWGSFDLAVTRFSGRRAPERPGADRIMREASSHEEISGGFWSGSENFRVPAYYSYTLPEPPGLKEASICLGQAFYSPELSFFILRYDDVRNSGEPEKTLMDFLQSTYEAGANLAHWDREALER
jgi:hypothetical protein